MRYQFHTKELLNQIPKVCGIYVIICLGNNKIYVGKAVDIRQRTGRHIYESKTNSNNGSYNMPIHAAFREHGIENFVIEILEECKKEDLNKLEKYYITLLKSRVRGIGYNISEGGDGGCLNTKITETQAYLIKELIPFGYTASEAYSLFKETYPENNLTKGGFRDIYIGHKWTEVNKEVFSVPGEKRLINRIKRTTGIDITEVVDLVSKNTPTIDVYNKYTNRIPEHLLTYLIVHKKIPDNIRDGFRLCSQEGRKDRKIKGINLITEEAIMFNSIGAAEVIMNTTIGNICKCCRGFYRSAGGYKWEYIN